MSLPDHQLFYLDQGDGEVILAIHSWPTNSSVYTGLIQHLAPAYRLIIPDLPGFGQSSELPISTKHTYSALADTLINLLSDLHLTKVNLLGVSLGGAVALTMASKRPDLINKIIVNSPPLQFINHLKRRQKAVLKLSDTLPIIKARIFHSLKKGSKLTHRLTRGKTDFSHPTVASIFDHSHETTLRAIDETLHEFLHTDYQKLLSTISNPVLVLVGDQDTKFTTEGQLIASTVLHGTYLEVPHAGHDLVVKNPEVLAKYVIDFLT